MSTQRSYHQLLICKTRASPGFIIFKFEIQLKTAVDENNAGFNDEWKNLSPISSLFYVLSFLCSYCQLGLSGNYINPVIVLKKMQEN